MVYAVHHVGGRIRIRNIAIKGCKRAAASYADVVRCLPGVSTVRASALTGSVVIEYDRNEVHGQTLMGLLGARPVSGPSVVDRVAEKIGKMVVQRLLEHSARALIAALI
jgi:hypothetical protein